MAVQSDGGSAWLVRKLGVSRSDYIPAWAVLARCGSIY